MQKQIEQNSVNASIELQNRVNSTNQNIKNEEGNSQQNSYRQKIDNNSNMLKYKKDIILQQIEQEAGENIKIDIEKLINKFYGECSYEDKRNCLIILAFVLYFISKLDLSNQIIGELGQFLKNNKNDNSVVVESVNDLKNWIKHDQEKCSSLFKFLSIHKIGYIMKPIIKDLRLNLENVCQQTSSLLIINNNLDAIDLMLNYQSDANNEQEVEKIKNNIFNSLEKRYAECKNLQSISNIKQMKFHYNQSFMSLNSLLCLQTNILIIFINSYIQIFKQQNENNKNNTFHGGLKQIFQIILYQFFKFKKSNIIMNASQIKSWKLYIKQRLFQKQLILLQLKYLRQFSLISMFETLFERNFVNLWSGMLQHLRSYNQIEHGKMFVLQRQTIKDAVKFQRLDFIIKCLKYYRQETQIILIESDVFYDLLVLINEPKHFSDIICILSQFYKLVKQRKQQEYLIEIFNIMLTNNINKYNNNNINALGTFQLYDQRGNKSVQNSPRSIRVNGYELCESQICNLDLQKYKINLSYILYTISPIITSTLIAKIFFVLSRRFNSPLKQKLLHVANEFLNLTILFSYEFDDLRNWKVILFDTIYPARYSLFQITVNYKEFFYPLLSLENIKNTIYIKWKSDYNFSFNIMACSSVWNIIQEFFYFQRRQLRDHPSIVPNYNQIDANVIAEQNNKNNFVFYQNSNSKTDQQQKQALQQSIIQAVGLINDQDLDNLGESGIKQRLVSQPAAAEQMQRPNNTSFSKMIYFLKKGIYRVDLNDISNKYYLNQKVVIEKSAMMRNILDLLFYIGLFIVCFYYSHRFIDYYTEFQKVPEEYLTFEFQQLPPSSYLPTWKQTCAKFIGSLKQPIPDLKSVTPNLDNYKELCKISVYFKTCGVPQLIGQFQPECENLVLFVIMIGRLGFILKIFFGFITALGLQQLYLTFFLSVVRPKIYKIQFLHIVDYAITILASVMIWHLHVNLDPFIYKEKQADQFDLKNNCTIFKNLLMFFFLLLWIRFFRYLLKTEKLGKVAKVFELMTKDLVWFFIILFIGIAAFSTFFFFGYGYEQDDYSNLVQTFLTLFSSIFGVFSIQEKSRDGQIYLIIFLIIFNIIILNILIALLSNTYNIATHHANMEYSLILYNDYRSIKKNDIYGSTYYFPPPLCVINLLISPFIYALPKYAKKINEISIHITYSFLMLLFTCIFFSLSLILIIPSYIITFFQIMFNSNKTFTLKNFPRFILAFVWLIFGILILLYILIFNDTYLFIKSSYKNINRQLIQKIFEIDQYEKVNIQFLRNILSKMNRQAKKKNNFSFSSFNASIYSHVPQSSNYQSYSNFNQNFINGNTNNIKINNQSSHNNYYQGSQSISYKMQNNSNNYQSINSVKSQNNINKQQNQQNPILYNQTSNNDQIVNGQNSNNYNNYKNQQGNFKSNINNEFNSNIFENDNFYLKQNMNEKTISNSNKSNNKNQNIKNTIQIPKQNEQLCEQMPKEKDLLNLNLNASLIPQQTQNQSSTPGFTNNNNNDFLSEPSYSIKVTPAPIIDHENKIVDSVSTNIDDSLGNVQIINQKELFIKHEFNLSSQFTADFNNSNQNCQAKQPSKFPLNFSENPFNSICKSKKNDQKVFSAQNEFQLLHQNNKNDNNLNNFIDLAQEEYQDEYGDIFYKSNQLGCSPALDVINSKKITEMYKQEIVDQKIKQDQSQSQNIKKQRESFMNQINISPPTLGPQQTSFEQDQSTGLWLELFIKRTSFSTNHLKYQMLLSFLQDSKKSVEINTNKCYKEQKSFDKQSEYISLVDVGMGKRALQKYLQGQQLISK